MKNVTALQVSSSAFSQAEKFVVPKQLRLNWNLKANSDLSFHDILFVCASYSDANVQSFMGCISSQQFGRLKG